MPLTGTKRKDTSKKRGKADVGKKPSPASGSRGRKKLDPPTQRRRRKTILEEESEESSDYIPSEESSASEETEMSEETEISLPKISTPVKKTRSKETVSPRQQLSARKRQTCRTSPIVPTNEESGSPVNRPVTKKQKTTRVSASKSPAGLVSAEAKEAVQKVEETARNLPGEPELNFTVLEGPMIGGHQGGALLGDDTMELPRGNPECFTGMSFVVSGLMESLSREGAQDLIKAHGGKITTSVSGKTSFLVVGNECGHKKLSLAREKGVKIIDKAGLFQLIRSTESAAMQEIFPEEVPMETEEELGSYLWVDKYKPESLDDLIGNLSVIEVLHHWLSEWQQVHLNHEDPTPVGSGKGKAPDLTKKAVLMSGSPGVGKTTAALLVAKDVGYDPVEVNASDTRNKADKTTKKGIAGKMSNKIQVLCQNQSISSNSKPLVLIMDEVDGMSSGDRGGIADLIANIKSSKIPIICICNDKYNRKLTSLKNHCLELNFRKLTKQQINKRMSEICSKEGLRFGNSAVLDTLIEQSKSDIRLLLSSLQFIRAQTTFVSYDDIRSKKVSIHKNQDISPFEACGTLLSPHSVSLSWNERANIVFEDLDLIPLLIQENYVNHQPMSARNVKERMKALAKAADCLSFGERLNHCIRSEQKWSLMPSLVHIGSLAPASIVHGSREVFNSGEFNFTKFTSFLGNLSTTNKQSRLLKEMVIRMSFERKVSFDKEALVMDYFPVLRGLLTQPLIDEESMGIGEVLQLMKEYGLSKDCYDYVMDITQFKSPEKWAHDPLKKIPSKVKAALTRQVNSANIVCPILPEEPAAQRKTAAASNGENPEEGTMATNPESGIIVEKIVAGDEEEEEEVEAEVIVEELTKSGYAIKEAVKQQKGKKRGAQSRKSKKTVVKKTKTRKV